jgi:glutamate formiminotransferase/glutamate formiminotransferase/formiminotetrahydrofolate cyclodeaminase
VAPLLSVPNVSEGRDVGVLDAIGAAFETGSRLLDRHLDADHHRAVFSLAGEPGLLSAALLAGATEAVARIDLRTDRGQHPHVGAIDVVPLVHVTDAERGAACAEALVTADRLADELRLPVFLYGALAGGRTRAEIRRGGVDALAARMANGELVPDFGPHRLHPSAGAVLVAARPPLVAFNVELAPPSHFGTAREIAAAIREGGSEGLPGLRAIAIELHARDRAAQVSMNVEDPYTVPLAEVVAAIARHADPATAEIVGLVPRSALAGFPEELEIRDFDAATQIIDNQLDG